MKDTRIAALVSGGVDSSVAVHRFLSQHPDCRKNLHLYYLKIWLEDELSFLGECPWEEDVSYVEALARDFELPFSIIPLQKEYHDEVISYTIDELKCGATPSPDIFCNSRIKFGAFLQRVDGADTVLSGHYGQIRSDSSGTRHLYTSPDPVKDQSYFLSRLNQEQLSRLCMPIGDMQKSEVRAYAEQCNLCTKGRKDSQGLCFLGKIRYRDFIKYHLGTKQGDIVDLQSGRVLGQHEGVWFFTIGQRTGLRLGGGPWYVVRKSLEENTVWVSRSELRSTEPADEVRYHAAHWIAGNDSAAADAKQSSGAEQFSGAEQSFVKLRHGPEFISAHCNLGEEHGTAKLAAKDYGIAMGQYIVFYTRHADGKMLSERQAGMPVYECLGSARIQ